MRVSPRREAEKEITEAALEAGIGRLEESIGVLCTVTNPPCLSGPPSHPLQGCPSEMVHRAPRGGGQQPQRDTRRGAGARRADPTGQHPGTSLIAVLQLPGSQMPPFNPPPRSVDSAHSPHLGCGTGRLWDWEAPLDFQGLLPCTGRIRGILVAMGLGDLKMGGRVPHQELSPPRSALSHFLISFLLSLLQRQRQLEAATRLAGRRKRML